jgi:hypothetical protein
VEQISGVAQAAATTKGNIPGAAISPAPRVTWLSAAPELDGFGNEQFRFSTRRIQVDRVHFLDWGSLGCSNLQSI